MHLLRCLHFFTVHYRIVVVAEHIAGRINTAADALSRNKLDTFISCSPQAPSSPSPIPQSLLDMLIHSQPDWRKMFLGTLAPSTVRSYDSGQSRYLNFCREAQVEPSPFVEHTLCMFCAHLTSEGLSHQTIKSYLSAIRHYHIVEGKGDPFIANVFPLLQYVLRGIKQSPASPSRQPRLPITPAVLLLLKGVWTPLAVTAVTDQDYIMLWTACSMGFFGPNLTLTPQCPSTPVTYL